MIVVMSGNMYHLKWIPRIWFHAVFIPVRWRPASFGGTGRLSCKRRCLKNVPGMTLESQHDTEEPLVNDEVVTTVTVLDNRPMETNFCVRNSIHRQLSEAEGRPPIWKIADWRLSWLNVDSGKNCANINVRCRNRLLKGESIKSKLRNFQPVFDGDEKLLRVGGRIRKSDLPRDQRHPLILPEKHHLTEIIITALHREHLHVGQNGLLSIVRQQFWPVNAKRTINRVVRKCVRCFRVNPKNVDLFMGDLPSFRVTASHPFIRTGVDYAGPVLLKQGRMKAPIKAYIALFVYSTHRISIVSVYWFVPCCIASV